MADDKNPSPVTILRVDDEAIVPCTVAYDATMKRLYDALAKEGGGTWANYVMMDVERAVKSRPAPTSELEWQNYNCPCAHPSQCDDSCLPKTVGPVEHSRWLPIARADKTITDVQDFSEIGLTLRNSERYWVRDEDGRVYEASWTDDKAGYWWDWEGESPVDPVEFMPHPLDPRFAAAALGVYADV